MTLWVISSKRNQSHKTGNFTEKENEMKSYDSNRHNKRIKTVTHEKKLKQINTLRAVIG